MLIAFLFAISTINSMMTPYSGYTKELYPTADRAVSLLMEDEGYFESENLEGTDWVDKWSGDNFSYVKKIGLLDNKVNNTLNYGKIVSLMDAGDDSGKWWEYPTDDTPDDELENASRALGLGKYNFYMQIRPINLPLNIKYEADQKARNVINDRGDVASVVRYSILKKNSLGFFDAVDLKGHLIPSKPVFGISKELLFEIAQDDVLIFTIYNWSVGTGNNNNIQNIKISDIHNDEFELNQVSKLQAYEFNVSLNDDPWIITPITSTRINMPVTQEDNTTFAIPISTFANNIDSWDTENPLIYVEIEIGAALSVQEAGITWFNRSFKQDVYPVKTTMWVW